MTPFRLTAHDPFFLFLLVFLLREDFLHLAVVSLRFSQFARLFQFLLVLLRRQWLDLHAVRQGRDARRNDPVARFQTRRDDVARTVVVLVYAYLRVFTLLSFPTTYTKCLSCTSLTASIGITIAVVF